MKFKVGDTVKIKENLEVQKRYGYTFFVYGMKEYRGKQAKITCIKERCYSLDIDNGCWNWTDDMLESVSKKYKVIVDGNTVTVTDDKGNTGIAKCSPEDEFNLSTGISLAIDRLKWKPFLGETYYTICSEGKNPIGSYNWANDSTDIILYERGLVFKTKEEAKRAYDKMLKAIREND